MTVIKFFMLPLPFMLQLAAPAPGLLMPISFMILKMLLLVIFHESRAYPKN